MGDFGGGAFVFRDADADREVTPIAGRLLAFTSGFENMHRAEPITWGARYVVRIWFGTDDSTPTSIPAREDSSSWLEAAAPAIAVATVAVLMVEIGRCVVRLFRRPCKE